MTPRPNWLVEMERAAKSATQEACTVEGCTAPDTKEFRWTHVKDHDELESFYRRIIPEIKRVARDHGYAIGVHGSLRRDLDLIAVPWSEKFVDKDHLVRRIHRAACGLESASYQWEQKPLGRMATSFPVCFPAWNEINLAHIDLSVTPTASSPDRVLALLALVEEMANAIDMYFSDPDLYECRGDEDCDHCSMMQTLEDFKKGPGAEGTK